MKLFVSLCISVHVGLNLRLRVCLLDLIYVCKNMCVGARARIYVYVVCVFVHVCVCVCVCECLNV